ncbi:sensor histidine kinase [Cellulosimicrobium marinum]|uniref:sensor histidine kinase n=1 Tax=Cellulosimicrobium marinum TaxID=1638992 RepID=UPI001E29D178|nr:ATP-binding protein [Cellulosimicrobium marinum]MCB7137011.1 histidine kinase [Cellulosimicrobium marinum]
MRVRRAVVGVASVAAAALTVVAASAELTVQAAAGAPWTTTVPAVVLATVAAAWFAAGAYLALVRPGNALGPLLASVGLVTQLGVAGDAVERAGWASWSSTAGGRTVDLLAGLALYLVLALLPVWYPSGRVVGRAPLVVAGLAVTGAVLLQAQWWRAQVDPAWTWAFGDPGSSTALGWYLAVPVVLYGAGVVGAWGVCVVRLVRARYPERQQLAWLLVAVVVLVVTMALGGSPAAQAAQAAALLGLPFAVGVGVVRYRLLDVRTAAPRVLTAVALAAAVAAAYGVTTALAGTRPGATGLQVVVVGVVALALLPVHARLRRLVDRFVYGTRADPVRAATGLRAAVADAGEEVPLDAALAEVAVAFLAPAARVRDPDGAVAAQVGSADAWQEDEPCLTADLVVAGDVLGSLELAARRPGERYTRADRAALTAMAGTVALVVRGTALAAELEAQRDAVLGASRVARERLRQDLHDGLGPSLTGLRLGLDALADALAAGAVDRAADLVAVLGEEVDRSVGEVRRIIDDLRPLDLVHADLSTALRRRLSTSLPVPVTVRAGALPPLPAVLEDAVFRVVTEAVANARRHAAARSVVVHVRVEGSTLVASVADDGCGLPDDARPGVGLRSMRARAEDLGGALSIAAGPGGTVVTLRVPLTEDGPAHHAPSRREQLTARDQLTGADA